MLPPPMPPEGEASRATEAAETPPEAPRVRLPIAVQAPSHEGDGEVDFPEYAWPDEGMLASVALVRLPEGTRPLAVDAGNLTLQRGDTVLLDTERGPALCTVTAPARRQWVQGRPPPRITRRAGEGDLQAETRLRLREAEATRKVIEIVRALGLAAKVVRVELPLTGNRMTLFLASEERIELRELGRALGQSFSGRVDIRNVGVRDAARSLGGVGPCGLQLCCNTFLSDFAPVSIRHAKDQGLALNPQRVSGVCGRLMCCLVYEDAFYRAQRNLFPKPNKRVMTPKGEGRVRDVDVLARTVRVFFPDRPMETFSVDALSAVAPPAQGPAPPDDAHDDAP